MSLLDSHRFGASAPARSDAVASRARAARARRRAWARDGLEVWAWVWPAVPVALWLAGGGWEAMTGSVSGVLTGLGILAGLVATAAVIAMLWLAARVPAIEAVIGQDRALALHSDLGRPAFVALVLHALFTVAGYALADGTTWWAEFADLWGTGDLVLAVLGLGALALVVGSSVAAVRADLPREVWFGIHLVTYTAVLVSLPHQFTMGEVFSSGFANIVWFAAWMVTFFVLATYRVFLPLFATLEHRIVVTDVTRVTPDTVAIGVRGRDLDGLGVRAGQFLTWRFLSPRLVWQAHPFSVSSAPDGERMRITVRALGRGTERIVRSLRPGTPVAIAGPYGVFTERVRVRDAVVLVGAGSGIGPIVGLLEEMPLTPGRATVVVRAHAAADIPHLDELRALCRRRGARLLELTGPRARRPDGSASWLPAGSWVTSLGGLLSDLADADVYVCGPAGFLDQVVADSLAAGVPAARIHTEGFAW